MPFSLDTLGSLFAPLGLISSLIVAGGLFWIIFRTRSTHIFLFRIWRLASGGVEVKDPQIQEYLEKQNSLMSFRFVSGLLSKRISDAHDVIAFGKEVGDETLEEFRNAGRYFNPSTKQVDLKAIPKPRWQVGNWILAGLGLLMFYLALNALVFQTPAFIQLRSTGTYFMLSSSSAEAMSFFTKDVRAIDCAPDRVLPTDRGFTPAEMKTICSILTDKQLETYLKPTLAGQGRLFLIILIAGAFLAFSRIRAQLEIIWAKKLAVKLAEHTAKSASSTEVPTADPVNDTGQSS